MRSENDVDSEDTDSETSAASSTTIRADSSSEEGNVASKQKDNEIPQLSERRSRVLMLTSRGVSYRYGVWTTFE
jgi:hypothetical protein